MPAKLGQAHGGGQLPGEQIGEQQPPQGDAAQPAHQLLGAFLQSVAFEQSDGGDDEEDRGHELVCVECGAKPREQFRKRQSRRQPRRRRRGQHDGQWIYAGDKPGDQDDDG